MRWRMVRRIRGGVKSRSKISRLVDVAWSVAAPLLDLVEVATVGMVRIIGLLVGPIIPRYAGKNMQASRRRLASV
jgi:hypothetical protein